MFIKHLTNREYQLYSNTSSENKDPDAFTNHYFVKISNDEIRIVTKKGLEKIRKEEKKRLNRRHKVIDKLAKERLIKEYTEE